MIAVESWQLSAEELAAAIRGGEVSAAEALEAVLDRADAVAPALNPFAVRLDDRARRPPRPPTLRSARGDGGPLCRRPGDDQGLALARRGDRARRARGRSRTSCRPRPAAAVERLEARGRRDLRQDDDAGVLLLRHHRVAAATAARATPGTSAGRPAARPAAPPRRSRPAPGRSRWAATAAARSASRPRSAGSSGSSRRFGLVPREPCSPGLEVAGLATARWRARVADARLMLRAIAGMTPRDRTASASTGSTRPRPTRAGCGWSSPRTSGSRRSTTTCGGVPATAVAALEAAGATTRRGSPGAARRRCRSWSTIAVGRRALRARPSSTRQHAELLRTRPRELHGATART